MNDDSEERRDHRNTPLYKKAEEIMELAKAIVEAAPDTVKSDREDPEYAEYETEMLEGTKQDMVDLARTIVVKLSGGLVVGLYDLQMEYACLVRRACRELVVCLRGLEIAGHLEEDHFNLLRTAVNKFQPLFAEWVATFKDSFYLWDDWELFNPPGAVPDTDL